MATQHVTDLIAIRDGYVAHLKALAIKPSYRAPGGQSVDWAKHREQLLKDIQTLNLEIAKKGGPIEVVERGIT